MEAYKIARALRNKGFQPIANSTAIGTFEYVSIERFFTQGINNRDNARWKRAQYLIIEDYRSSAMEGCIRNFLSFAEPCQYILFSNTDMVYDGRGRKHDMNEFLKNL